MQFAKLAIFACLLVAVALAAETEKKDHHKSHNRNKAHHKSRNHKEGHHERKHNEHKESHERSHGSHMAHSDRSHGHGKSDRAAVPQPRPDCACSAWECPITTTTPEPTTPTTTPEPTTPTTTPDPTTPTTTPDPTTPTTTPDPTTPTPTPTTTSETTPTITTELTTSSELTTTPKSIDVTPTIGGTNGNWELEIKINGNVSVRLIFNAELKFFGIFNADKKLAIIFDGNTGFVGIFNIETNAAIFLNLSADLGIYVENAGDIKGLFGANFNFEVAFKGLFEIVKNIKIDANGENSFKISVFLKAVVDGKLNASLEVFKKIGVSFAAYVALLVNVKAKIAVFGVLSVVIPIFVEINNISTGLLQFLAAISLNLAGKFEATIFAVIRKKIELEIAAGVVILAGITGAIRGVGTIFVNLDAAIKAYVDGVFKSISSGKVITINGVITITTALLAEGSWLITLVNDNINVGIYYNKAANVFGILNKTLNVAVVILSQGNLYAFVNIATGGVLVANFLTGNARIVTDVELKAAFAVDVLLIGGAFAKVAVIIKANANGLGNIFAPKDSFNLGALVASLALSIGWEAAYNLVFIGSAAVKAAVDLHFKAIFIALRVKLGIFGALAQGGLALILPIAGDIKFISEGFFKVILGIYSDLKGTFDAKLMLNIFIDFNVSIVKYVSGEATAIFGVALNAIGHFKGFIGSIIGAITGVVNLIQEAYVNIDINIGFDFGFGGAVVVGGGTEGGGGVTIGGDGGAGGGVTIGGGGGSGVTIGGGGGGGVTIGGGGGGGVTIGGGGGVTIGGGGGVEIGGGTGSTTVAP